MVERACEEAVRPAAAGREAPPAVAETGSAARDHVLLTVLGTNSRWATYELSGRTTEARLAPVALLDLLQEAERPARILAVCTPEARRETWPLLECTAGQGVDVKRVDVPNDGSQEDLEAFLHRVSGVVGRDAALTVDVTHGFRHFSFLTYAAVLYLQALRGVPVRGAWYGMLNRDGPSPFLDLRPLLDLPRWVHALEVLGDTGDAGPIARILEPEGGANDQAARACVQDLSRYSEAYLSGLPLELGRQAATVRERRKSLRKLLRDRHRLPLVDSLVKGLLKTVEPYLFEAPDAAGRRKARTKLSRLELERQARLIDDLLERGSYAVALGLMSEWTVSWVVWRRGSPADWLDYGRARRGAAGVLNAMRAIGNRPELAPGLTPEQRCLARFWGSLSDLRNGLAHHGMRPQPLIGDPQADGERDQVLSCWHETLRSLPEFSLQFGEAPGRRVLVSPIGMRPGVLFSALEAARSLPRSGTRMGAAGPTTGEAAAGAEQPPGERLGGLRTRGVGEIPDLCLAVCSSETRPLIDEALRRAGFEGDCEPLELEDAFGGGRGEIDRLVSRARGRFVGAGEVLVNVTGGTTLMGLAAESLASEARLLACPSVRRFGLIDRRPLRVQEDEPYRAGEPFWLDDEENAD